MFYLFNRKRLSRTFLFFSIIGLILTASGCLSFKGNYTVPVFLSPLTTTDKAKLISEIDRYAQVKTVRGKVLVKFEDNSFAESGIAEKYKSANGSVIVQTPANINLKIELPVVGSDLVQMTSDGDKFRVAVICCVEEKYKKFVYGKNASEYLGLQERARTLLGKGNEQEKSISVFASLRPQHFTDALLMRPIQTGGDYIYTQSEIYQDEEGSANRKSRTSRVIRGYYLLDELKKQGEGDYKISRRFWFDRIGGIRLSRQQVFDDRGVLETDIIYGIEEKFTDTAQYSLPIQVQITRPQERYSVKLTYQEPAAVIIGKMYDAGIFQLENKWNLPEIDLDKRAEELKVVTQPNQ